MTPSAKVIAFPARASCDEGAAHLIDDAPVGGRGRASDLKLWLVILLAPLLLVGSVVLFLAVVGVWLVWLVITCLLVAGVILFARKFLRRIALFGFRRRAAG